MNEPLPESRAREITLIGAGQLAEAVCWLLADEPRRWRVARLCARQPARAEAMSRLTSEASVTALDAVMAPPPPVLLLAVSDDAIAGLAVRLADQVEQAVAPGSVALHCSGSLTAEALAPLRRAGYAVASLHPARSFAQPCAASAAFAGTVCAIEGDAEACQAAQSLADAWGGQTVRLDASGKRRYHAASVMANNLVVALLESARQVAHAAGLSDEQCQSLLRPLAEQALANYFAHGGPASLTGPISRGDAGVVRHHLLALEELDPAQASVYRSLSVQALELAGAQGRLSSQQLERLHESLRRVD